MALAKHPPIDYTMVIALGTLSLLADWLAFETPLGGSVSLGFVFAYAAVLLGGPVSGVIVALFHAVTPRDVREHKPPLRMVFNAAQLVVAALLAGWALLTLGGVPLLHANASEMGIVQWLFPAGVAALVHAGANMALVALAMSLSSGLSVVRIWALGFREYLLSLIALVILGLVLAQLVTLGGYWSVVLLVVPFLVARQTFRVYQEHADAYRDTLRSLVSAIEAKDTYTRGHSERVAHFAKGIAEELGYAEKAIQRIEWAALLHDIGKIAISTSTLRKPAALTEEEYREVQGHPQLAADVLGDIDFLEDILPMIRAHHERVDGTGYPAGLSGDEVNMGARILAVADCYDAMTSNRPYRSALHPSNAIDELSRCAGSQLDSQCVSAFITWANRQAEVDQHVECA